MMNSAVVMNSEGKHYPRHAAVTNYDATGGTRAVVSHISSWCRRRGAFHFFVRQFSARSSCHFERSEAESRNLLVLLSSVKPFAHNEISTAGHNHPVRQSISV